MTDTSIKFVHQFLVVREKIGDRPFEVTKVKDKYVIRFYPMIKTAKNPDRILFCLTVSKKEFEKLASKIN